MKLLRKSIEQLSAPICPECAVEMAWYRSMLRAAEQVIAHVFVCPRCGSIAESTTPVKPPSRSEHTVKLIEECASGLREILEKWGRRLN